MEVLMNKIRLENFKGCKAATLVFDGRDSCLRGENATGKTTVFDAYTWLLFGCDSHFSANFEIKPLGADGQVADHAAMTTVEAEFLVNGALLHLRKVYQERWSTRRGSSNTVFDGHTTDYYVDDVPTQKREYDDTVSQLVSSDVFRMLTAPDWFCSAMPWKERRKVLFEMCNLESDTDIMAKDAKFDTLAVESAGMELEKFKAKLISERKGANKARDLIPARMDEVKRVLGDGVSSQDLEKAKAAKEDAFERENKIRREIFEVQSDAATADLEREMKALGSELELAHEKNKVHRSKQSHVDGAHLDGLLLMATRDCSYTETKIKDLQERIAQGQTGLEQARKRWIATSMETYQDGVCSACGQPLPEEQNNRAKEAFQANKAEKLSLAKDDGERLKNLLAQHKAELAQLETKLVQQQEDAKKAKENVEQFQTPEVTDMAGYQSKVEKLSAAIATAEEKWKALRQGRDKVLADAYGQLAKIEGEKAAADQVIAKAVAVENANARLAHLQQEKMDASKVLERIDNLLFLLDEFTRFKVESVESAVNDHFELVKFRLFQEQVNGGLSDCCDVTVGGVPYGSLNNGARINGGLDVIRGLSGHYGVAVPLFVDNAESVTALQKVNTQMIRLVVDEHKKELTKDED